MEQNSRNESEKAKLDEERHGSIEDRDGVACLVKALEVLCRDIPHVVASAINADWVRSS